MRILPGGRALLVLAVVALAVVTPSRDLRAELLTIDDCEYTPATVSETWQPRMGTPAVRVMSRSAHGGRSAVRIDCPFSGDTARSVADCAVRLDLSRAMRIRFDLYVENAHPISKMTVYLRSGKGWYRGDCPDFGDGWQTVEIERVAMRAEKRMQVNARGEPLGWLCPSHPENRKLELDSMLEVARNYEIDGLHFDYIRYPGPTACFCDGCRERFQKETGRVVKRWPQDVRTGPPKQAWLNWRCANITRLVKAVSDEARKIRPGIRISAAVFPNPEHARRDFGQDWLTWVREGYVDFVCPMNYIPGNRRFSRTVARQVKLVDGRVPLYSGIGVLLRHRLTPEQTIAQINLAREAGARGFCLFNFGPLMAAEYLPALAEGVTRAPAKAPHGLTKETER